MPTSLKPVILFFLFSKLAVGQSDTLRPVIPIKLDLMAFDTLKPPIYKLTTQYRIIESLCFNSTGKRLLSGSGNSTQEMEVGDTTLKVIRKIRPHKASNWVSKYFPDDKCFISGSYNEFQIFGLNSDIPKYTYHFKSIDGYYLDMWTKHAWFNSSGDILIQDWWNNAYYYSKFQNKVVKKWIDTTTFPRDAVRSCLSDGFSYLFKKQIDLSNMTSVEGITFSSDLSQIMAATRLFSNSLSIYDAKSSNLLYKLILHADDDGRIAAFCYLNSADNICIADVHSIYLVNIKLQKYSIIYNIESTQMINSIAYSKNSKKLAIGTEDREDKKPAIYIVDLKGIVD